MDPCNRNYFICSTSGNNASRSKFSMALAQSDFLATSILLDLLLSSSSATKDIHFTWSPFVFVISYSLYMSDKYALVIQCNVSRVKQEFICNNHRMLWLQGAYIYDGAVDDVHHMFNHYLKLRQFEGAVNRIGIQEHMARKCIIISVIALFLSILDLCAFLFSPMRYLCWKHDIVSSIHRISH